MRPSDPCMQQFSLDVSEIIEEASCEVWHPNIQTLLSPHTFPVDNRRQQHHLLSKFLVAVLPDLLRLFVFGHPTTVFSQYLHRCHLSSISISRLCISPSNQSTRWITLATPAPGLFLMTLVVLSAWVYVYRPADFSAQIPRPSSRVTKRMPTSSRARQLTYALPRLSVVQFGTVSRVSGIARMASGD